MEVIGSRCEVCSQWHFTEPRAETVPSVEVQYHKITAKKELPELNAPCNEEDDYDTDEDQEEVILDDELREPVPINAPEQRMPSGRSAKLVHPLQKATRGSQRRLAA